jgi:hypothetical protein
MYASRYSFFVKQQVAEKKSQRCRWPEKRVMG